MPLHRLPEAPEFNAFSLLCLNEAGHYVEPGDDLEYFRDGRVIHPAELPEFLKATVCLPPGVTDVFVWVHGWRNDDSSALSSARRLFHGLNAVYQARKAYYGQLSPFNPGFVAIRWPSWSSPLPEGYRLIRDRAKQLTEAGDAAFFLASLLGYLETRSDRVGGRGSKTLAARDGFLVHCLGHSFGGRFLTAAIRAAAAPEPRTLHLLESVGRGGRAVLSADDNTGFRFTVDSLLVFQMAAPHAAFGPALQSLAHDSPIRGPIVLTCSRHDAANCMWHRRAEGEAGIGCEGASEPAADISGVSLRDLEHPYEATDFRSRIVNVFASHAFTDAGLRFEGAHSDFWYEESMHLALSLANLVRE